MDEIRRRLAHIEAQLSGQSLHARLIDTAGLFFPAVGLMTGIVAQHAMTAWLEPGDSVERLRPETIVPVLLTAALCVGMACTYRRLRPPVAAWGALLCFVGLGAVRLSTYQTAGGNDIRHCVGAERVLATIRGRILTQPSHVREDWCFAELTFTDPQMVFYVKVDQIKTGSGWVDASGVVRVQMDEPALNLRAGDAVQAYCWLHRFAKPRNPGQFDLAAHLAQSNIYVGASVPSADAIQRCDTNRANLLARLRMRFSQAASAALLCGSASADDPHGLAEALLLGNRDRIDRRTFEAFRRTGLLHLVSLSGMHLGIFAGAVWWLGRTAGLMKPGRAVLCALAVAAFLLTVPARAPTVRAAVIVWAFCAAAMARRRTNVLNALCLAAIILLLIRPTHLFEAGWQLSFAAVAGILALTGPIEGCLHDLTHGWFRRQDLSLNPPLHAVKRMGGGMIRLLAAGLGAWIGGAGILLYHFRTVTPLASLWTMLVSPLVSAILTIGFAKIILFFLLPSLAAVLGPLLALCTDLLAQIVILMSHLDTNTIVIGRVTVGLVATYYGLVLFARFGRIRRPHLKHGLCVALAIVLAVWIGTVRWSRTHRDHLQMTCLDVGHGQAIVVQLPGTKTVLFDAGSMHQRDIGSRIVVPFLNAAGIAELEAIIVSHGDVDHVNGIPEIVDACTVCHVYAAEAFGVPPRSDPTADLLVESLRQRSHTVEPLPTVLDAGAATIRTLWPPDDSSCPRQLSDNNRSLVLLIEFAGVKVLLCSDIEEFAQQQLQVRYPELRADIVVVPHHGSPTTQDKTFLEGLGACVQISSCDRKQYARRGHSAEEENAGGFSTAQNGAISVCIDSRGMVSTTVQIPDSEGDQANDESSPRVDNHHFDNHPRSPVLDDPVSSGGLQLSHPSDGSERHQLLPCTGQDAVVSGRSCQGPKRHSLHRRRHGSGPGDPGAHEGDRRRGQDPHAASAGPWADFHSLGQPAGNGFGGGRNRPGLRDQDQQRDDRHGAR